MMLLKFLPNFLYSPLAKIYHILRYRRAVNGLNSSSLSHNEKIFYKLQFNKKATDKILNKHGYSYKDIHLSWHYHIFAGWFDFCKRNNIQVKRILEIGTHNGEFANFLSKVYKNSEIFTIDLPVNDENFTNTYNRADLTSLSEFLSIRSKNLASPNINFFELNSINLVNFFKKNKFNAIWIDGDHHNPQVTIDIIHCIGLAHKDCIICTDDVINDQKFKKDNYVSNDSFITINHLEKNNILKSYYVFKKTRNSITKTQKFISIARLV